ncbi:DEAD/DEAH box helicase [Veillonella seminalis]|uniref:DEAD/DEAH box helicase n=1 Tax=Veillonella seminalis TaxID=1502943 RepID=UPI003DA2A390
MQLKPHQISGINMILNQSSTMICDDMGLGKTATVITAVLKRNAFPILVICPASLKLNWQREFKLWGNVDACVDSLDGDICITNYERIQKLQYDIIPKNFKQLVFDECHVLKNDKSIRSKVALKLSKAIPYKVLMSGTPMLNRPKELWSQIEILGWQSRFGGIARFHDLYCGARMTDWGMNYDGFSNLDDLRKKFIPMIICRTKDDLEDKLPQKNIIELPMISCPQPPPRSLQEIEHYDQIALRSKMTMCIDFIETKVSEGEQVVVFVHHKNVGKQLNLAFPTASVIVGGQSPSVRQKNVNDFQEGKTDVIICSLQASAVGITLTASRIAVFIEYPWSPTLMAQAQDRIHRLSQKRDCFIYYLYAKDSIDEYRLNLNKSKEVIIDYIMEG